MSRIETSKVTQFVALGPPADQVTVSKLVMFVILVPGDSGSEAPRQGHVYAQVVSNS